jgi:hypothetical protein
MNHPALPPVVDFSRPLLDQMDRSLRNLPATSRPKVLHQFMKIVEDRVKSNAAELDQLRHENARLKAENKRLLDSIPVPREKRVKAATPAPAKPAPAPTTAQLKPPSRRGRPRKTLVVPALITPPSTPPRSPQCGCVVDLNVDESEWSKKCLLLSHH